MMIRIMETVCNLDTAEATTHHGHCLPAWTTLHSVEFTCKYIFFVFEFLTLTKKCSENQEHIKRIYLVLMFLIVDVVDFFKNWQRNIVRFSFSSMLKQIEQ